MYLRQANDFDGVFKSKSKPPLVASPVSAAGTDANSQVRWAVKMAPTTPVDQEISPVEPAEMKDLRRLLRERYGEKRSIRQAFLTWDIDKDGRLCVKELQDMLTRLGFEQTLGKKKVDAILQHVVSMPTGSLLYDDFCGFVRDAAEQNLHRSNLHDFSSNRRTANESKVDDIVPASDPDCVVSLLRSKYESRRFHQVFRDWDIDKSGGVTMAEIESNLRRQGLRIAKPQLMKLFNSYDLNHDGRLLYNEFMCLMYGPVHEQRYSYLAEQRRKKQQEKRPMHEGDSLSFFRTPGTPQQTNHSAEDPGFRATLQCKLKAFASRLNDAYAAFDDDHNGKLSYRELCHGLQELGLDLTERECLHLATYVDADRNGEISFKEFCDVFSSGEASNERRRSTFTDDEDKRVEEQTPSDPKTHTNQQCRPCKIFDFSHLTRRTKIPTRCGRTPYANTSGIISSNQEDNSSPARFVTEAQLYGSGSSRRPTQGTTTLGQEEKLRRDSANINRLQRLRVQLEQYEDRARPLQDSYNLAQERRVRTLRRHQESYQQRIEEQRPRQVLSPARRDTQMTHLRSTAPFV
ncbi:EF-hand calcium-binding domain-containing protein 6 [Phytophthora citrophthora]|uniref:EF-hand calcium-binding domain-containing protein 6 n=1 Tax=Phytophthora citrophthora TaxID=4793 RepID=A0AAD9GRM2_9STRA|nr:EF-hand calcium-binding domain-containing protein 6 [Phytophthora citrophthora]